jgi:hypothetical protein
MAASLLAHVTHIPKVPRLNPVQVTAATPHPVQVTAATPDPVQVTAATPHPAPRDISWSSQNEQIDIS